MKKKHNSKSYFGEDMEEVVKWIAFKNFEVQNEENVDFHRDEVFEDEPF